MEDKFEFFRVWHSGIAAAAVVGFLDAAIAERCGNPFLNLSSEGFCGWCILNAVGVLVVSVVAARSLTMAMSRFGRFCARCGKAKD